MKLAEVLRQCEETTHGRDGVLLGTQWVDLSQGRAQCPFVLPHGSGVLCCALQRGHQHGHRDSFIGAQLPQTSWVPGPELETP